MTLTVNFKPFYVQPNILYVFLKSFANIKIVTFADKQYFFTTFHLNTEPFIITFCHEND